MSNVNQNIRQPRVPNTRLLLVNQGNIAGSSTAQAISNNNANQNSVTQKLCKFFLNLLELERGQGRYELSVSIIQKYINQEITIEELGSQLKGNTNKADLPESLMTSLNSNIDHLRREMINGRVRIEGIQPPPESVLLSSNNNRPNIQINNPNIIGNSVIVGSGSANTNTIGVNPTIITATPTNISAALAAGNIRLGSNNNNSNIFTSQLAGQPRPTFQQVNSSPIRQIQPNQNVRQTVSAPQIIRQPISSNTSNIVVQQQNQNIPSIVNIVNNNNQQRNIAPQNINNIRSSNPINSNNNNSTVTINSVVSQPKTEPEIKTESNINSSNNSTTNEHSNSNIITSSSSSNTVNTSNNNNSSSNVTNQSIISLPANIINPVNYRNYYEKIGCTVSDDAFVYVSESIENFCQSLCEQLAAVACHRNEIFGVGANSDFRKIDDVRSQIQFLQKLDAEQRISEEERQKQELIKASKSRSRVDSQEQQRLKETVRKIQEHEKNCEEYSRANQTALKAIGVTKRKWIEGAEEESNTPNKIARTIIRPESMQSKAFINSGFLNASLSNKLAGGATSIQFANNSSGTLVSGVAGNSNLNSATMVNRPGLVSGNITTAIVSNNKAATLARMPPPSSNRYRTKRIILKDFQLVVEKNQKLTQFKNYQKIFNYGRF